MVLLFRTISRWSRSYSTFKIPSNFLDALNYVSGSRHKPTSSTTSFPVIEPATGGCVCCVSCRLLLAQIVVAAGRELCQCPVSSERDVNEAVEAAEQSLKSWSTLSGLERGRVLRRVADLIRV